MSWKIFLVSLSFLLVLKALEENKQLREKVSELVTEKDEMRNWYEKVTKNTANMSFTLYCSLHFNFFIFSENS